MASIRKLRSGKYQVQIRKTSHPSISKCFISKQAASEWGKRKELELELGYITLDFYSALDKYKEEALPLRRGKSQCLSQLKTISVSPAFANCRLDSITPSHVAKYRDLRLADGISPSTVRKDLALLHRIFELARYEWGVMVQNNPVKAVRKPRDRYPTARSRRLEDGEFEMLREALSRSEIVQVIFELAIETGMRRSEILNIKPEHIKDRVLLIPETKNGTPRAIPLTLRALQLLKNVPFNIKPDSVSQAFARACKRSGINNLRFHDLRHEATSRFFELGLNPTQVALITGHKDPRMLSRYTHLKAKDLLELL